jgi:hypothetical protein
MMIRPRLPEATWIAFHTVAFAHWLTNFCAKPPRKGGWSWPRHERIVTRGLPRGRETMKGLLLAASRTVLVGVISLGVVTMARAEPAKGVTQT